MKKELRTHESIQTGVCVTDFFPAGALHGHLGQQRESDDHYVSYNAKPERVLREYKDLK